MELRGLEPLTSSMPWKRATSCAKAPRCGWVNRPRDGPILPSMRTDEPIAPAGLRYQYEMKIGSQSGL